MPGTKLIIAGGVMNALLLVFHCFFWLLFDWPGNLLSLSPDNRAIIQVLNIHLILVFAMFAWASLYYRQELLETNIGRLVSWTIGLFYVIRAVNELFFWNIADTVSQIILVVSLGIGLLYLIPLLQTRYRTLQRTTL